jgi:hypothetical protein
VDRPIFLYAKLMVAELEIRGQFTYNYIIIGGIMAQAIGSESFICAQSQKRCIVRALSWSLFVFGALFFLSSFILVSDTLSTLAIWLIVLMLAILSIVPGIIVYRRLISERIIMDDVSIRFVRNGEDVWHHPYTDIERAGFVRSSSFPSNYPHWYARLFLTSGLYDDFPVGMERPLTPVPLKEHEYRKKYLPMELLGLKKVKVEFDSYGYKSWIFQSYTATLIALILLVGVFVLMINFLGNNVSSRLIRTDGQDVAEFSPRGRLERIIFSAVAEGNDGKMYVGTRRKGVLCFSDGGFASAGRNMPPCFVRALYFDKTNAQLYALTSPPFPEYDHKWREYVLKNGVWKLTESDITGGKDLWYNSKSRDVGSGMSKGLKVTGRCGALWELKGNDVMVKIKTGVKYRYHTDGKVIFIKFINVGEAVLIGVTSDDKEGEHAQIITFDPQREEPFQSVLDKFPLNLDTYFDFAVDEKGNIWTYR